MKTINDIIVRVPKAYKNTIELDSGLTLFLSQDIKQIKDTIRYGEVLVVPEDCPIDVRPGDTLFFHHNIVAVTVMEDPIPDIESSFLIDKENGIYRVPIDDWWPLAYARIRNGEFKVLDGICFVEPLITKKYDTFLEIPNNEKEVENIGKIVYSNKGLEAQGIVPGTKVIFSDDSEYKFEINGQETYCMFDRWLLGIYEG